MGYTQVGEKYDLNQEIVLILMDASEPGCATEAFKRLNIRRNAPFDKNNALLHEQ